jgi:hypothetical protein
MLNSFGGRGFDPCADTSMLDDLARGRGPLVEIVHSSGASTYTHPECARKHHETAHAFAFRVSAFPPLRDIGVLAQRFNLTTPAALRAFLVATPFGLDSRLSAAIEDDADYGCGYDTAALMQAPPTHAARCRISTMLRNYTPPGHMWWTDISNAHPEDFAGNTHSRLFADERTGHASTYYSCRKDSATFIEHLKDHVTWIGQTVPGGAALVPPLRLRLGDRAPRPRRPDHDT